ncbi:type IV pilus modification protein PilV [Acidihalobacter aeolianus]|uniref:Type IV pilus modification protein PilV n=1 Tax=Acidihalobacter aeolianus TaxID=2792603 RepID=A0A1D8KBD8_9GAMM|nr:type IV pilus modification protein PilV [Acidihalobacter aeolianus]
MVALLVISIGLLGVAGLQALAVNNTHTASLRSIAAIEAANMAAYMGANPAFWAQVAPSSVTVVYGGATPFSGAGASTLNGQLPSSCTATLCTNYQMAAWDMYNWGKDLAQQLPSGQGGVQCKGATAATSNPYTCVVTVQWQEKSLGLNATSSTTASTAPAPTTSTQTYSMVTQP